MLSIALGRSTQKANRSEVLIENLILRKIELDK